MLEEKLFEAFPSISKSEWKAKVKQDLKGKPFENLIWESSEGFQIQPFYTQEDLEKYNAKNKNLSKKNTWRIRENIIVKEAKNTNQRILNVLNSGVNALCLQGEIESQELFEALLENVLLEHIFIHFENNSPKKTLELLSHHLKKRKLKNTKIQGGLGFDFINFDLDKLIELFKFQQVELPKFKLFQIKNKASENLSIQVANTLKKSKNLINELLNEGFNISAIVSSFEFHFTIGNNFCFEIAKLRAFKNLWQQVVEAYGGNNFEPFIHCENQVDTFSEENAETNMIRATSQCMSAVIGGTNSFRVLPFKMASEFTNRIARNTQLILKHEAYLDEINDAASGSYYIENLTDKIAKNAWKMFTEN